MAGLSAVRAGEPEDRRHKHWGAARGNKPPKRMEGTEGNWGLKVLVLTRNKKAPMFCLLLEGLVDEKSPCRGGHMRDILRWKEEPWLA